MKHVFVVESASACNEITCVLYCQFYFRHKPKKKSCFVTRLHTPAFENFEIHYQTLQGQFAQCMEKGIRSSVQTGFSLRKKLAIPYSMQSVKWPLHAVSEKVMQKS